MRLMIEVSGRSTLAVVPSWLCAATLLVSTAQQAAGETWFGPAVGYTLPETPTCVSLGHLNADPYVDCAVGARTGNTEKIYILLNDGTGGFSTSTILPVANGWNDLEVGDFNGDGRDDIAFCEDPLKVYYADVFHNYAAPATSVTWPNSSYFRRMAVADLDNDGFDDLIGRYSGWYSVFVLFGSPSGLSTPPLELHVNLNEEHPECDSEATPTAVFDMLPRDVDKDGDLDIALSCEYKHGAFCGGVDRIGIGYIENLGARVFAADVRWIRNEPGGDGIYWEQFDVAEMTGDLLPDILYERSDLEVRMLVGAQSGDWTDEDVSGVGGGGRVCTTSIATARST